MPQKIIIKFKTEVYENGTLKGFDYYMVTLNVPSFTKCAKIYGILIDNIKRASFIKPEQKILTDYILDFAYQDKLVQFHLKLLVDQINPDIT